MNISRPSPALIVSIVALVVACAGTATAASLLISNSSQVKTGALNGSDIKNGSLSGLDLKNDAITSRQVKSDSIAAEDLAPAVRNTLRGSGFTAQEAVRKAGPEDLPAGQARIGVLKELAPGTYFVTAKTTLTAKSQDAGLGELVRQNKTANGECTLTIGGDEDKARGTVASPGSQAPVTVNMQMTRTIDAPTDVVLSCAVNDIVWRASDTSIVALKLQGSTRVDTVG